MPVASLVSVSSSGGQVTGGLGVSAKLFEGTTSQVAYAGSIDFNDTNIFDATPIDVSVIGFSSGLQELLKINSSTFKEAIGQLGTAIDGLRNTSLFDASIGLARSLDVGSLVQIKQAWDNAVTNLFSGSAPVQDLQTLLSRLG